jgi:hypothetical protein
MDCAAFETFFGTLKFDQKCLKYFNFKWNSYIKPFKMMSISH